MENHMSKKVKICLLCEYAYSLLTGEADEIGIGGAELQMTILAKELAKRLYDVSFVTFQKTRTSFRLFENIKIYVPFDYKTSGYTYLLPWNIYKLLKILEIIDADIYIQKGKSPLISMISFYSKLKNKSFIHLLSSDNSASSDLNIKTIKNLKNIIYRYGVKYCDYVICQTNHQKELLNNTIGKMGRVIKNMCIINQKENVRNKTNNLKVIWVGRLSKAKKPDLFLLLAKNIPDFRFWMIGAISSSEELNYYREIKESAKMIKNLDFIGFVPHNKIFGYYEKSYLLINTSPNEGFPNTFLEAWSCGIPVVSLNFDPDEIICKYKLGFHSMTFDDLVKDIRLLLNNEELRITMGINAKNYVLREHNIHSIMDEYEKIINEIIDIEKSDHHKMRC